jgi:hypothetical protein
MSTGASAAAARNSPDLQQTLDRWLAANCSPGAAASLINFLHQTGFVIAPLQPTQAMLWSAMERNSDLFGEIYRAMIEPLEPKEKSDV